MLQSGPADPKRPRIAPNDVQNNISMLHSWIDNQSKRSCQFCVLRKVSGPGPQKAFKMDLHMSVGCSTCLEKSQMRFEHHVQHFTPVLPSNTNLKINQQICQIKTCIKYPIPYTLYPVPCTLYPIPFTLYPIPYTL